MRLTRLWKGLAVLAAGLLLCQTGWAFNTWNVPGDYMTVQAAVSDGAVMAGDVIQLASQTYPSETPVYINKANITIQGAGLSTIYQVSGTGYWFSVVANGVTIRDIQFQKTDVTGGQDIIWVNADNVTIQDNLFWGQYDYGEGEVTRAMVVSGGRTGLLIDGNTVHNLRQPCYVTGPTTGTVSSNHVYLTRGWVLEGGNLNFTDNTWGTGAQANVFDIAIIPSCPSIYYTDIVGMSNANNGAVIEDQRVSPAVLSVVHVNAAATGGTYLGSAFYPYQSITPAATRVVPGGTIHVASGTYNETVTFTRSAHLLGAGSGVTMWRGATITSRSLNINRNNTTPANIDFEVAGFSFETENNQTILADWSNSYTQVMTLDIHDNHFAHVNTNHWGNDFALWVDAANQGARGTQGAIRVHNNVFDLVTGGVLFENCRAVDVVDNTFNVTNEAVIFTYYSSTGQMGEHLVAGNSITAQPIDWAMGMNNYFSTGTYTMLPNVVRNNVFGSGLTFAIRYNVEEFQSSQHDFQIHDNSILSGSIYVRNTYAYQVTLDASGNWWGSVANPAERVTADRVDYTPWLGSGSDTSADPGFQGDFGTLWVDDGGPQSGTSGRVQEAIGLVSGSTIHVTPGTYVENGQVVLDKNLTIIGDAVSKPVMMTNANTAVGNVDSAGWWLQIAGTTCAISNLIFDGSGHLVDRAFYTHGTGTISDCEFRNIAQQVSGQPYQGRGITIWGAPYTVQRCELSDIGRIGIYVGSDASGTLIEDCVYTGKGTGDWLDYGVEIERGSSATVQGCTLTNCLGEAYDGSTSAGALLTTYFTPPTTAGYFYNNTITGNTTGIVVGYNSGDLTTCIAHGNDFSDNAWGVTDTAAGGSTDALGNWWGAASGPYHATLNPLGTGVPVSDHVLFDPWMTGPYATNQYALMQTATPLHISSIGGSPIQTVVTYTLDSIASPAPEWFHYTAFVDYDPALVPFAVTQLYGVSGSDYFTSNINNNPNGRLQISFSLLGLSEETDFTGNLFTITFTGTGNDETAEVSIHSFVLRERFGDGQADIAASVDTPESIWVDGIVPGTPLVLRARPRHNGVYLAWTAPTPAADSLLVYRASRTGYPWCPNLDLPAMHALGDFVLVATIPGTLTNWTDTIDDADRDVYDYYLKAKDVVGHVSGASNTASATSYFLGDWADHDGAVGMLDLNLLAAFYGTGVVCDPLPFYPNGSSEVDVAPTSTMGSFGLPSNHDGLINFEDLIIFAMNYQQTLLPLLASAGPENKEPAASTVDAAASLTLTGDETGIRLVLDGGLLGYSALLRTERELVSAEFADGVALYYPTSAGFRVDVAGMGGALTSGGSVALTFAGQGPVALVSAEGRNLDNGAVATTVATTGDLNAQPLAFALAQNFPNPFNPVTTIRYALPEATSVKLALYNALGQEVMVLVQGTREAGTHEVRLDGSSLASGVYVYRLEAGLHVDQKKLVLVK